jgi:hypothetical protein
MLIKEAYKATRILETLSNYSIADNLTNAKIVSISTDNVSDRVDIHSDDMFWNIILKNPDSFWNKEFGFYWCVVSEWVARIPGLFWAKGSESIRNFSETEIANNKQGRKEYSPPGKSGKVLGGVGTLKFLPDINGNTLYTLTFSCNSSVGIPALFTQEIIDSLKIRQGDALFIRSAKWVKMSLDWARQFESTKNIPRGYLLINDPNNIKIVERDRSIECHPFSIMEYQKGNALLFDYVFVTSVMAKRDNRKRLEVFFENYKKKENRNGKYLFACDITNPLFKSKYNAPFEMKDDYENNQMDILEERIRKEYFKDHAIDEIVQLIPTFYKTAAAIRTLTDIIELPVANLKDDSAAKMSIQLLQMCIENNKVENLIDRMAFENPSILK